MRTSKPPTPCSKRQLKRVGGEQLPKAERALECMKCYPSRHNVSMSPECDSPIVRRQVPN